MLEKKYRCIVNCNAQVADLGEKLWEESKRLLGLTLENKKQL